MEQNTKYSAEMIYSPETIRRLCDLQYNTFNFVSKLIQTLGGIAFIIMGLLLGRDRLGIIVLAAGCFTVVSLNYRSKLTAQQLCRKLGGNFPALEYSISDTGVITQQIDSEIPFSSVIRIVDDSRFLYLFINENTVFMIDTKSVKGYGGLDGMKKLIAEKTGLKWKKPFTLLGTNLATIKEGLALSKSADKFFVKK